MTLDTSDPGTMTHLLHAPHPTRLLVATTFGALAYPLEQVTAADPRLGVLVGVVLPLLGIAWATLRLAQGHRWRRHLRAREQGAKTKRFSHRISSDRTR